MKRALAFTLMVLAIMIIAVSCEEPHVHTFSEDWTYDSESHWHKSTCGHEDEVSEKAPHTWKEGGDKDGWITEKEATETEKGSAYRICTVCEYNETKVLQELSHVHTYSSYYRSSSKHWKVCTSCGEKFFEGSHSSNWVGEADGHYKKCYCGYETTNKTAHTFGSETSASDGNTIKTCTVCGYQEKLTKQAETKTEIKDIVDKLETITSGGKTSVQNKADISIAAEVSATSETGKTEVTFSPGSLKLNENAKEIRLTVVAAPVSVASLNGSGYQITKEETKVDESKETVDTTKAVVAGFEFKLEGADASDLSGTATDAGTTVTTFIAPGLGTDKSKLQIKYIGSDGKVVENDNAEITAYNNENGELTFKVYHFSKYVIIATDIVATDNAGGMYASLWEKEEDGTKSGAISSVAAGGTVTLLKDATITGLEKPIDIKNNLTINLNGKTLTVENAKTVETRDDAAAFNILEDTKVVVENGNIIGKNGTTFCLKKNGAGLTLNNVKATLSHDIENKNTYWPAKNETDVVPKIVQLYQGVETSLMVTDSTLTVEKGAYGIASEATVVDEKVGNITVTIKKTTVETKCDDSTALLLNVPGSVTITGSTVIGDRQGAILRGGEITISGSTFKYKENDGENKGYETTNWKAGNAVPNAAVVIGNRGGSYAYPTTVTFNGNNTLTVPAGSNQLYVYQADKAAVDDVDRTVTVKGRNDPNWKCNMDMNGASYFVSTWDGSVDISWYNANQTEFTLTTADQLAGLAELVNRTENSVTFENKTINLANDINLNNIEWTPIGLYKNEKGESVKKPFSGTFDGNGHTISGLEIDLETGKTEYNSSYRALFGYVNGEIKDLTVRGTVTACDSSGVVAALGDGGKLDNIKSYVNVSVKIAAEETKGSYQAKIAGLVATVKKGNIGCTITNCENHGTITSSADNATDAVGGILAFSDVKKLTVTNCKNYGNVTAGSGQVAGGIIGTIWALYAEKDASYSITECTNDSSATISGGTTRGSIIGENNLNLLTES